MARSMIWVADPDFHGWICSECEWNSAIPTLLQDPEARSAFDRLASGKFRGHVCADHLSRTASNRPASLTERMRVLVKRGYKPKDAAELVLQEIGLEFREQKGILKQAEAEAVEFLRRVRDGII
jgi:DNA-binding transcriptional ArsR family regulator